MAEPGKRGPGRPRKDEAVSETAQEARDVADAKADLAETFVPEMSLLDKAAEFVYRKSPDRQTCPLCAGRYGVGEETLALMTHLKQTEKHRDAMFAWFLQPELGPNAWAIISKQKSQDEAYDPEDPELEIIEDNLNPNFLSIPHSTKKKLDLGARVGRWIAPGNVRKRMSQGYVFEARPENESLDWQHDHTGTQMRANELVYMTVPRKLHEKRKRLKEQRNQDIYDRLPASIEQKSQKLTDVGQETYDAYARMGVPHEAAMKLANRAEKEGHVIRPRSENAVIHQR